MIYMMEKETTLNLDDQEAKVITKETLSDIDAQYNTIAPYAKRLFKSEISFEEYKNLFKFRLLG